MLNLPGTQKVNHYHKKKDRLLMEFDHERQ